MTSHPKGNGILVAADESLEWLLPWWWERLQTQNRLPVCFVDLGLSHYGRSFCQQRGELVNLSMQPTFSALSDETSWETLFGKNWKEKRSGWFKKPFAFLTTPFEKTLWLDIDCEVLKPIDALFEREGEIHLATESESTQERERGLRILVEEESLYNSGVVLYSHGSSLIGKWAEAVAQQGKQFCSDQHVLSHLIYETKYPIHLLEKEYNWHMAWGLNIHAAIIHWVGSWGKEFIRRYCGIAEEFRALQINL